MPTEVANAMNSQEKASSPQLSSKSTPISSQLANRVRSRRSKSRSLDGSNGGFLLQTAVKRPRSNSGRVKGQTLTQPVVGPLTSSGNTSGHTSQNSSGSSFNVAPNRPSDHSTTEAGGGGSPGQNDQIQRTKEAAKLATMVMNMKLATEESTKQTIPQPGPGDNNNNTNNNNQEVIQFSQGTSYRARKAKAKLELQYQMVQNYQDDEFPDLEEKDSGLLSHDGVYNPLQTIRNRIHRPASGATRPDMLWHVTPQELVQDYAWQHRNKHRMRDRKGRLIYKDGQRQPYQHHRANSSYSKSYGDELTQRIKAKLGHQKTNSSGKDPTNIASDSSISEVELSAPQSPIRSYSEDIMSNKKLSEDSMSPLNDVPIESIHKHHLPPPSLQTTQRKSEPAPQTPPLGTSPLGSPTKTKVSIAEPPAPLQHKSQQESVSSFSSTSVQSDPDCANFQELKYLQMVFYLSHLRLQRTNQQHNCTSSSEQSAALNKHIDELSKDGCNNQVSLARSRLQDVEKDVKGVLEDLNNTKAPRMDSILVESDKLISQVSTTLNLEVRKAGERMDKLEGDAPSPVKWMTKIGYVLLEWTMVLFMWVLWLVISTVSTLRTIIYLVVAIAKWLLFL